MNKYQAQPDALRSRGYVSGDDPARPGIDLSELLDAARRRWPMVAAIAVMSLLAALAVALLVTPKYDARTRLKISPNQRPDAVFQPDLVTNPDQAVIDSEVSIIRSGNIAAAVIRKLKLASDPEFNPDAVAQGTQDANAPVAPAVIGSVLEGLNVAREPDTYLVDIGYRTTNPAKSAAIANAFADEYLAATVEQRTGTASRQSKWLQDRLAALGAEVREADARVAEFRARAGIVEGTTNGTITDQQVAPLSNQLATAEAQAAAARSNLAAARGQIARGGIDAVSSVLSSPVVADLRRQRTEIVRDKAKIEANYGDKHPESIRVRDQLAGLDRQIAEESRRIVAGLQADARAAEASAGSLRGQLSRLRGEQAGDTRAAVTADSLERQAEAKRTVYNQLAQAAQQSNQETRSREPQGTVVERAQAPVKPSFPDKPLFVMIGLLVGLVLGTIAALVVELLSTGLRTVSDVENGLGVPFIVSVPTLPSKQRKDADGRTMTPIEYVAAKPMSSYGEALRTLRNAIVLGRDEPVRIISIASSVPGEGKTSTAAGLARVMALSGDRVVMVDCDLRRGSLSELAPSGRPGGLIEVLSGELPLEQALVSDAIPGLDILPVDRPSFTPKDIFSGEEMRALLTALSARYDYVLLDTPPLLAVSDARTLTALADETFLMIRWQRTPKRAVQAALNILEQAGARVGGAVMSMVSPNASALGADNPAYYYGMYRQYHQA